MALPVAWRTKHTSNTAGTGTLTLNAADGSARSIYTATGGSARAVGYVAFVGTSSQWEVGTGTFNGGNPGTLTRATVIASSNGGSLVSFSGTIDVILNVYPGQVESETFTSTTAPGLGSLGSLLRFTGSGNVTKALPVAANVPVGAGYLFGNSGSSGAVLTLDPNGAELIDGVSTLPLFAGETTWVRSTGSAWVTEGLPPVPLVRSQTVSGTPSTIDFVLPTGGVAGVWELEWYGLKWSADAQLLMRTSTDSGATFDSGASDYNYSMVYVSGASASTTASGAGSSILLTATGADNASGCCGKLRLFSGNGSNFPFVYDGASTYMNSAASLAFHANFGAQRPSSLLVSGIRLLLSTGTFTAGGVVRLYFRRTGG